MPDQGTIFSSSSDQTIPPKSTEAPATGTAPDKDNPLAILVGEGRKYKTVEDLAKAYLHIDGFAETLKGENTKLREDLTKAATLEQVLERLKAEPAKTAPDQGEQKGVVKSDGLSTEAVAKIVRDTVTGMETARTREANLRKADAEMRKLFGEKAAETFSKEASTPQLRQALMELASISPDKFVALFAPQPTAGGGQIDGKTSVNTAAMEQVAVGRAADPGCKEFYDNLRRKNPQAYYSQATQLQIHQQAMANPDKYFGRKST